MAEARKRPLLVDAHVHCHACFDLGRFLDHAQRNFDQAAESLAVPGEPVGVLALTEGRGERSFERFLGQSGKPLPGGWHIHRTTEAESLVARRGRGVELAIVAGQQIRLRDGLELLAVAGNPALPDGGTPAATAAAIRAAGALPVLPWGFGKWTLRRRRIVERLLDQAPPGDLLLADSGTRAALAPYPRLLVKAERLGFCVVAGSDPLPLAGEIARPGSFGCLVEGRFSLDAPAAALRLLLSGDSAKPRGYGTGRPLTSFLLHQLAMQLRARATYRKG